jgi:large subunit ribosomal protein L16
VSKKPAEVRMGKGKGSIHHYIARVSPGSILFELNATNEILARQAFKIAASK